MRVELLLSELELLSSTQKQRSAELGTKLDRAQRQLATLSGALELWREHSEELESSLERSSSALATLRSSYDELARRYAVLSRSWEDYRTEAARQAALLERVLGAWRATAIVGPIVAVAATAVAMLVAQGVIRGSESP